MKRIAPLLLFGTSVLTPYAASAALATMIQFGSFETRGEAEKRLDEVKAKYSKDMQGLSASVREVKLPPDNLVVFRTQAGPLSGRDAARDICTKLAAEGEECYIVQTAVVDSPAASAPAMAPVVSAAAPAPEMPAPPAGAKDDGALRFMKREAVAPLASAEQRVPDVMAERSQLPKRATAAAAAVAPVVEGAPPAPLMAAKASEAEASALPSIAPVKPEAAMAATAAPTTDTRLPVLEPPPAAAPAPGRSFWSRLNPLSGDAEAKPPVVEAKPVVVDAKPMIVETPSAPSAPAAEVKPAASAPVFPPSPDGLPVLPPPPAPLKAATGMDAPPPPPVAAESSAPPAAIANANVKVEEAIHVPVSEAPLPAPSVAPVPAVPPLQPPVALNPSSTDGVKTVWAQIGPFTDGQAALSYWTGYRHSHPDYPVVRVQVSEPLKRKTAGEAWLRVGPILRQEFVKSLCSSVPQDSALRCGVVKDMGVATNISRVPGLLGASRYAH